MKPSTKPTLIDRAGMGGVIAQGGFDYQTFYALARLPTWLRNPSFKGMILEGLEDVEAQFFAPHALRHTVLERYQAKSGVLDKSELAAVIGSFERFESAYPQAARAHILVTPALPPSLAYVARDSARVRHARPFYHAFPDICEASDDLLRSKLVRDFGTKHGSFLANHADIELFALMDRAHAENAFLTAFEDAFPLIDSQSRKLRGAFTALLDLCAKERGGMLARSILLDVIGDSLGVDMCPDRSLPIHVRSDRNGEQTGALEIDASAFSGGPAGIPDQVAWHTGLLAPLDATARWARGQGLDRVALSGSFRISTAIALGWAFRSVTGFQLDIPTRSATWPTDDHPSPGSSPPGWEISRPNRLVSDRLAVAIGVLRDPVPSVRRTLGLEDDGALLRAFLPEAVRDSSGAQSSVMEVRAAIDEATDRLRPAGIDLFYAGPVALATALGHRWNALPSTQLHEYVSEDGLYVPSALIG